MISTPTYTSDTTIPGAPCMSSTAENMANYLADTINGILEMYAHTTDAIIIEEEHTPVIGRVVTRIKSLEGKLLAKITVTSKGVYLNVY